MAETEKCPRCEAELNLLSQFHTVASKGCADRDNYYECHTCWGFWRAHQVRDGGRDRRFNRPHGRRATDQPAEWPEGVPEENGLYWRSWKGEVSLVSKEGERWFRDGDTDSFFFLQSGMKFWRIEKPEPHSSEEG